MSETKTAAQLEYRARRALAHANEFAEAVLGGDIDTVREAWSRLEYVGKSISEFVQIAVAGLRAAIECDNVGIANWVESLYVNPTLTKREWNVALAKACRESRFMMAGWIWRRVGKPHMAWGLFALACGGGSLAIAKWLWELVPNKIEHAVDLANLFCTACGDGDRDIAEWIWGLNILATPEHIARITQEAPHMAACGGNLEILIWLKTIGIDSSLGPNKGLDVFLASRCGGRELIEYAWKEGRFNRLDAIWQGMWAAMQNSQYPSNIEYLNWAERIYEELLANEAPVILDDTRGA